jgi:hypothetical protein
MINLSDLKNEINNVPGDEPVFIYIGVGAASSSIQEHLAPEQYHQFPPFLQNMRNLVPNLHLFLVLIDPLQENPPRVAVDYQLVEPRNDYYRDKFLQVFVYRHRVYTDVDLNPPENGINITETLRDLNKFVKEKQTSLLYHDFTGRKTIHLAEYFDMENMQHLDQLVYSLSAREDHGCFFDLTQPNAYFPFKANAVAANAVAANAERPIVKMFNYYKYIVNNSYEDIRNELAQYPAEMKPMADVQREQIINNIRTQFKNNNLSILRQVKKLLLDGAGAEAQAEAANEAAGAAANEVAARAKYLFSEIPHVYQQMFTELYTEKNYALIHELLYNYSASELDILSRLKGLDLSGEELLTFITADADPYKWHNNVNILL